MAAVRARKAEEAAQEAKRLEEGTAHENVTEGEAVQDMGHLEKKAMRRELRKGGRVDSIEQ